MTVDKHPPSRAPLLARLSPAGPRLGGDSSAGGIAAALSAIAPKRPRAPGWRRVPGCQLLVDAGWPYECWSHDGAGLGVISAVEVAAEHPGAAPLGPAFHLSVSAHGARCSSGDALWVLAQFDLSDAKEDNHVPSGRVRNFWRYVADHLSGYECGCQDTEPAIAEDKGDFVWRGAPA